MGRNRQGQMVWREDIHERNLEYLNRCQEAADYCAERSEWRVIDDIRGEILSLVSNLFREEKTEIGDQAEKA